MKRYKVVDTSEFQKLNMKPGAAVQAAAAKGPPRMAMAQYHPATPVVKHNQSPSISARDLARAPVSAKSAGPLSRVPGRGVQKESNAAQGPAGLGMFGEDQGIESQCESVLAQGSPFAGYFDALRAANDASESWVQQALASTGYFVDGGLVRSSSVASSGEEHDKGCSHAEKDCRCATANVEQSARVRRRLPPFAGKRSHYESQVDGDSERRWMDLSGATQWARAHRVSSALAPLLVRESMADQSSEFAPLYPLWAIDSCLADGQYDAARSLACDSAHVFEGRTSLGVHVVDHYLLSGARAAEILGDLPGAERQLRRLTALQAAEGRGSAEGWAALGRLYAAHGATGRAVAAYRRCASEAGDTWAGQWAARTAVRLVAGSRGKCRAVPEDLARELLVALRNRDASALDALASETHFSVRHEGHLEFADRAAFLERLSLDMRGSWIEGNPFELDGSGDKRYLETSGWLGAVFLGRVRFLLVLTGDGWEWHSVIPIGRGPEHAAFFRAQFGVAEREHNDPLAIAIKAPWPAGRSFMAGGVAQFAGLETSEGVNLGFAIAAAAIGCAAAGPFSGICAAIAIPAAIAANFVMWAGIRAAAGDRPCGFGPGGSYYNQGLHRVDATFNSQYAIDFTQWERANAFPRNLTLGTPVLAVHSGVVRLAMGAQSRGSEANWNVVVHSLVATRAESVRYHARYGHLDGPDRLGVSAGMWVSQGSFLGYMDDTGNSTGDHLHFEIFDNTLPLPGSLFGRTTRPTPMDVDESGAPQELLGDGTGYGLVGNESRCIYSTNVIWTSRARCLEIAREVFSVSPLHGLVLLAVCSRLPVDPTDGT